MDYKNIINEQLEALDLEVLEELAGRGDPFGLSNLTIREIIERPINREPLFEMDQIAGAIGEYFKEIYSAYL